MLCNPRPQASFVRIVYLAKKNHPGEDIVHTVEQLAQNLATHVFPIQYPLLCFPGESLPLHSWTEQHMLATLVACDSLVLSLR